MSQLYRIISEVALPVGASPIGQRKRHIVNYLKLHNLPIMFWPSGNPCHLANAWLTSVSEKSTGRESATTKAALLTHLVRFCYARNISFYDFNDAYFETFTTELMESTTLTFDGTNEKSRSSSHTLTIQTACLYFLLWVQDHHPVNNRLPIIGIAKIHPGVIIEWRHSAQFSKPYLWHRSLVTKSPPLNDKTAMPDRLIAKIRDEIYQRRTTGAPTCTNEPSQPAASDMRVHTLNYMYSRRMFVVNMMVNFGLRPEELWDMPLDENSNIIGIMRVVLPTKKLRSAVEYRTLKINLNLAITLQTYIDDRSTYLNHLAHNKISISAPSRMLIGENGRSFKKSSLTKEFDRICDAAGIKNMKVCLSMFRHRFITREVKAEMILRLNQNPDLARELTPSLRDEIARAVIKKTGQRRPSSIWPYVHDEYKLLTTDSSHEQLQSLRDDLEQKHNTILDVAYRDKVYADNRNLSELDELRKELKDIEVRLYNLQNRNDS